MADDNKKYCDMEQVFQQINRKYVSLDENLIKRNNIILEKLIALITSKMSEKDVLFAAMYRKIFFGGSYYDGLKIGKPEEYDLDLLLDLPKYAAPTIAVSNMAGFVSVQLVELEKFKKQTEFPVKYAKLVNLLDDDKFLCTDKVLRWMESLIIKSLQCFPESGNQYVFDIDGKKYFAKVCKGGPAFTLKVNGDNVYMDIDLVPCFVFTDNKWPQGKFRQNPYKKEKPEFFIVPKPIKGKEREPHINRCWRLSFQEQERFLMNGMKKFKPALKLMKKLRDQQNHKFISSYYLKTVFLWEISKVRPEFWGQYLGFVYVTMLKKYQLCLEERNIPYYWNSNNNLIGHINNATVDNIKNKIKIIINEIEKNLTNPYICSKALLSPEECMSLKTEIPETAKPLKGVQQEPSSCSAS